jgi:hypothetical protein
MGNRYHYLSIATLPRLHQIVWCRLPEGNGLEPGNTVRPAVVRETKHDPASKRGAVRVSYGTTKLNSGSRLGLDLIVQSAERLAALNLPQAVRFDLEHANWLPWADEFFGPPAHSVYIVAGALNEGERRRLRKALLRRGIINTL